MGAQQVLMAPGRWSGRLKRGTPRSVLEDVNLATQGFSELLITPARVDDAPNMTIANLRSLAAYSGMFRRQPGYPFGIGGAGAEIWLGDEQGKGHVIDTGIAKVAGTFVQWITDLCPFAVTAGTLHAQAGTLNWTAHKIDRRKAIDYVCDYFAGLNGTPLEWRLNYDTLTVDAGTVTELYGATPTAVATPDWSGREPGLDVIRATIEVDVDLEDWSSKVTVDNGSTTGAYTMPSIPYNEPKSGFDVVMHRYIDDSSITAGLNSAARGQLERFAAPRTAIRLHTDDTRIITDVPLGSRLWVWDPSHRIYDLQTANEITVRGQSVWPKSVRVIEYDWPFGPTAGKYLVRQSDSVVVDLTDWWEAELGQVTVGVDAQLARRTVDRTTDRGLRNAVSRTKQ